MKIKLHDRVKLEDGRTGSIVFDDGDETSFFICVTDNGDEYFWLDRDDPRVTEIIGHRYFVDTPFTIGETYETYDDLGKHKVVGVGLIVESVASGSRSYRHPNGMGHGPNLLPAKPEPLCEGKTVEIDGKKYRLSLVEG